MLFCHNCHELRMREFLQFPHQICPYMAMWTSKNVYNSKLHNEFNQRCHMDSVKVCTFYMIFKLLTWPNLDNSDPNLRWQTKHSSSRRLYHWNLSFLSLRVSKSAPKKTNCFRKLYVLERLIWLSFQLHSRARWLLNVRNCHLLSGNTCKQNRSV